MDKILKKKERLRKCIACNRLKSREQLIKITIKKTTGEIKVNPDSKFFGRSAYICKNDECVNNAFKKGKFFKILHIKQDDNIKEKIRAVLEK